MSTSVIGGYHDGGNNHAFRGASFMVADLTGARFLDCDMSRVRIVDSWLVDVTVSSSGQPDAVTVRLSTHELMGVTERDVSLAQQISTAAHDLGVTADPRVGRRRGPARAGVVDAGRSGGQRGRHRQLDGAGVTG